MFDNLLYYLVLGVEAALGTFGVRLYEEPQHQLLARLESGVEIRRYEPRKAAEVTLDLPGKDGRSQAFRLLFGYISGANAAQGGEGMIAMTAPVEVQDGERLRRLTPERAPEAGGVRMRFFLPAELTAPPPPSDPRVRIVSLESETVAILRFSGDGEDFVERQAQLLAALASTAWKPAGPPYALSYDAPFTIAFLRRNEAAVPVRRD